MANKKDRVFLTPEKYKQLKDELAEMKTIGRKLLADKLDQYRSENKSEDGAAFNEVINEKEALESRIEELTEMLDNAEVKEMKNCDNVELGCKVTLENESGKVDYQVVSSVESDPSQGKISQESPLGSALLGKKKGDKVEFKTPERSMEYKVVDID
jgi:transcription elongation factor GreA